MTAAASVDHERLQRLLAGDDLAWLLERMRRRLARGRDLTGTVTRSPATSAERAAVARLLGRRVGTGGSVAVSLDDVAAVVTTAGLAPDLRTAVEALVGPVADERAAGVAADEAWRRMAVDSSAWASACGLQRWLDEVTGSGLLRRQAGGSIDEARRLLGQVRAVVAQLPAGGVPLPRFAAATLGDAKALDRDRPLTALAVGAAAVLGGVPPRDETQSRLACRREVWASVGVLLGELNAPVLTVGLPGDLSSGTGRLLGVCAERGEPLHLTLRQLIRDPPRLPLQGARVWVCENPSVVAVAADALGDRCPPLICTGGQPSAAVSTLLRHVVAGGGGLDYHGDFDWPGVQMTNSALRRYGATPWRMGARDYLAAAGRSRRLLEGRPVAAAWDDALTSAMASRGVRVEEELVVDDLLADLEA